MPGTCCTIFLSFTWAGECRGKPAIVHNFPPFHSALARGTPEEASNGTASRLVLARQGLVPSGRFSQSELFLMARCPGPTFGGNRLTVDHFDARSVWLAFGRCFILRIRVLPWTP